MQTRPKPIATAIFTAAWLLALSVSVRALLSYESAPGRVGAIPTAWPMASRIPLSSSGQTLLMFAHPRCPCTRASMGELEHIMAKSQGKLHTYVLFLKPEGSGTDWDDTGLRRTAAQIPGVKVLSDLNGSEAKRFGAETSGQTLLFDADGRLLFSGGITESRGHAGGNAGESAIISLVNQQDSDRKKTFVFGCPIFNHAEEGKTFECRN